MHKLTKAVPKLQTLRVFEAAGRLGSFTAAGRELGLSQPAVTQQIRQLERALGLRLFERTANQITLNSAGSALLGSVTSAFDILSRSIDDLRDGRPTFVLAVNPGMAQRWMVPHLTNLQALLDTADLRLWLFDRDTELLGRRFDAAVHLSRVPPDDVASLDLFAETVTPVASAALAHEHGLTEFTPPDQLPPDLLLHLDGHDRTWMQWSDWFAGAGASRPDTEADPKVLYSNHALLMQDVIRGTGIGLGWSHLTDELLTQNTLVTVGVSVSQPNSMYRLLWPDTTPQSSIDTIVEFFTSTFPFPVHEKAQVRRPAQ